MIEFTLPEELEDELTELELELEREGVLTDEELEEPNYKIFTVISAMRTYQLFNHLETTEPKYFGLTWEMLLVSILF